MNNFIRQTVRPQLIGLVLCAAGVAHAAAPSFRDTATPEGWTVLNGHVQAGNSLQSSNGAPVEIRTTAPLALPVEATVQFRAAAGDTITVQAVDEDKNAKPLLDFEFVLNEGNKATVTAKASGANLATTPMSSRRWDFRHKNSGSQVYQWRFPRVKSLWDDRDYREIGAANSRLVPFEEKVFTVRLTLTPETRQIWLDDRLVGEARVGISSPVHLKVQIAKTTQVLSAGFVAPLNRDHFTPLALDHYSHLKEAQAVSAESALAAFNSMPMLVPKSTKTDINLGDSINRYRLTDGSGPDAGYVDANCSWQTPFSIDPGLLSFRVPFRQYQNVWLLTWVDEQTNAVPKGSLQFYKEGAGYPVNMDFDVSPAAIDSDRVRKLSQKTADGKQLYLVKVPVDTAGMYGMRDMADQFLEFVISKPVALMRIYPDPMLAGYFPAGLPSSLHVVGITLEEAPFGFAVEPKHYGFIFEQPEKPSLTVSVTNTTAEAIHAKVSVQTRSFSGEEQETVRGKATIEPGKSGDVELVVDVKKLGWHELKVAVDAGGVRRSADLSMVLLPPNTRTYGTAVNENRFGMWTLDGHYVALDDAKLNDPNGLLHIERNNQRIWETYRKLGLVMLTTFHTGYRNFAAYDKDRGNTESLQQGAEAEATHVAKVAEVKRAEGCLTPPLYFYGGEWEIGNTGLSYGPWPLYSTGVDAPLPEETRKALDFQIPVFTAIGKAIREKCPAAKLLLNWGASGECVAHMRRGMPKEYVDGFGMDAPMFELMPEVSNALGTMNKLWMVRAEAKRLGWPCLPIYWTEGPFLPTIPGSLTMREQMDHQIRYLLQGLAYGMEQFPSGIVPQDAGNYYGAENYGAGLFHRVPLDTPKPAVAAVATMTSILCGADPVGSMDTGCATTFCMEFQREKDHVRIYALWRVRGTEDVRIKVRGTQAVVTDAMGNAVESPVKDGVVVVSLSSTPIWLTGVEAINGFELTSPVYDDKPVAVTRPLPALNATNWTYDVSSDKWYEHHYFAVYRTNDSNLRVEFGQDEKEHADAVAITLPVEPGNRPQANRYGTLVPKTTSVIPGKASALGIWMKGNSSWGRVVYQLRDAKGQTWISLGTKDSWNCDDLHCWSYANFEGWRYLRFPLPGNHPFDASREPETTWWGSSGGDGIVALPLTLEKIFVEARNEIPVLGKITIVSNRTYKLAGLVAEYDNEEDPAPAAVARNQLRMPRPDWTGPAENPIAKLAAEGVGAAPAIKAFEEPMQANDGRQMNIKFDPVHGLKYKLYVTRYPDGRGADLLVGDVKDGQSVGGFRPETTMFFFLTSVDAQKKESKPSKPFQLVTHDKFLEK